MAVKITLNRQLIARNAMASARKVLERKADAIGAEAVRQAKRRFTSGGDEEGKWPSLWASNDPAVRQTIEGQTRPGDVGAELKEGVREAKAATNRLRDRIRKGDVPSERVRSRLRAAKAKERAARDVYNSGNPSYRRGGQPMLDTGKARASMTYRVVRNVRGVGVQVGSPLPYLRYHQTGFSTTAIHFIPLSIKAKKTHRKGANPEKEGLIRGVDYLLLRGVDIPARPIVRFTKANKEAFAQVLARKGV